MATVFLQPPDQRHADLGQLQETTAHAGGVQHAVDLAEHDGSGTASDPVI